MGLRPVPRAQKTRGFIKFGDDRHSSRPSPQHAGDGSETHPTRPALIMAVMRTLLALLLVASTAVADPPAELAPRRVTLAEKAYDVADVLSAIKEQTGNPRLVDRRSAGSPTKVTIGFA